MPVPLVVPRAPAATRRAALGGALASLAAASACDVAQPAGEPAGRPGAAGGGPSGSASASAPDAPSGSLGATPAEDPDAALVDAVLVELGELSALVAAATRFAPLRASMRALAGLHAAHREALEGEPATGRSPEAFAGPAEALRRVRVREQQAQRRLADWAVAAESGALARLLASMSAGVAQQLAVLPAALPAKAGAKR